MKVIKIVVELIHPSKLQQPYKFIIKSFYIKKCMYGGNHDTLLQICGFIMRQMIFSQVFVEFLQKIFLSKLKFRKFCWNISYTRYARWYLFWFRTSIVYFNFRYYFQGINFEIYSEIILWITYSFTIFCKKKSYG